MAGIFQREICLLSSNDGPDSDGRERSLLATRARGIVAGVQIVGADARNSGMAVPVDDPMGRDIDDRDDEVVLLGDDDLPAVR